MTLQHPIKGVLRYAACPACRLPLCPALPCNLPCWGNDPNSPLPGDPNSPLPGDPNSPLPVYTLCRGLVAAFANAGGVSLSRCAPQLRFQHQFEDMLAAVARGEADRWASGQAGGGWCLRWLLLLSIHLVRRSVGRGCSV